MHGFAGHIQRLYDALIIVLYTSLSRCCFRRGRHQKREFKHYTHREQVFGYRLGCPDDSEILGKQGAQLLEISSRLPEKPFTCILELVELLVVAVVENLLLEELPVPFNQVQIRGVGGKKH